MKYMLDTNICVYAIKNKPENVSKCIKKHDPDEICISTIVFAELEHGVAKSVCKEKNERKRCEEKNNGKQVPCT